MTINKSQGQSLNKIGLYLPEPIFGHGQLQTKSITRMKNKTLSTITTLESRALIHVKVYRQWTARHIRTHAATELCYLLLDNEGKAILAVTDITDQTYFDNLIRVGEAYEIGNYRCEKTSPLHGVLDNNITLRFGRITTFKSIPNDGFPNHYFNFVAYNQLEDKIPYRDKNGKMHYPLLTDYIGVLKHVDDPITTGTATTNQPVGRKLHLQNLMGKVVEVMLWGNLATSFDKDSWIRMEQPVILAISSCRVSKYRDVQMTGTAATHWYFNPDIPEAHNSMPEYRLQYQRQPPLNTQTQGSPNNSKTDTMSRHTLQTLLQYNPETYKTERFRKKVKITSIHTYTTWYYQTCSQCPKKVRPIDDTQECINHGIQPNPRFRFCFRAKATDETSSAIFTFFSPAGDRLTNISCQQLATSHPNPFTIPPAITSTIGKTYVLEFRYTQDIINTEFTVDNVIATEPITTVHPEISPRSLGTSLSPITPSPAQARHSTTEGFPTFSTPYIASGSATTSQETTPSTEEQHGPPESQQQTTTAIGAKRSLFQQDKGQGKKPKQE